MFTGAFLQGMAIPMVWPWPFTTMNITSATPEDDKVKMRDVETLLFRKDMMTTGRRSSPVSQMICTGQPCRYNAPDSISCKNIGWNGKDPIWDCTTSSMKDTKLSTIEVQCEGYEYPDDPNILVGSCAAIYKLSYTTGAGNTANLTQRVDYDDEPSSLLGSFACVVVLCSILSCMCSDDYDSRGRDSIIPLLAGAAGASVGASMYNNNRSSSWGGDSSWGGGGSSWGSSSAFGGTSRR